jgi:hypothetical protein
MLKVFRRVILSVGLVQNIGQVTTVVWAFLTDKVHLRILALQHRAVDNFVTRRASSR